MLPVIFYIDNLSLYRQSIQRCLERVVIQKYYRISRVDFDRMSEKNGDLIFNQITI